MIAIADSRSARPTCCASASACATIEAVLGLAPMGLNDALARPMSGVFDTTRADWSFKVTVPAVLRSTRLPLPPETAAEGACLSAPSRSAAWWAAAMAGQNFNEEDRLDTAAYNRALWRGLKGDAAYPTARSGRDLSQGRAAMLTAGGAAGCGASLTSAAAAAPGGRR